MRIDMFGHGMARPLRDRVLEQFSRSEASLANGYDLDPRFVVERWPGGVDRLLPLLRKANPSLPLPVVQLRLALAIDVMLRSLAHRPTPSMGSLEAHVSALLDFLTGAFEAANTGEAS